MQGAVTGASSGAQEDAVKAEAKVQDLQGRLKLAEQDKAAAEKAQKVSVYEHCSVWKGWRGMQWVGGGMGRGGGVELGGW